MPSLVHPHTPQCTPHIHDILLVRLRGDNALQIRQHWCTRLIRLRAELVDGAASPSSVCGPDALGLTASARDMLQPQSAALDGSLAVGNAGLPSASRKRRAPEAVQPLQLAVERGQDHARRKQRRLDETPGGGSWEEQLYVVEQILARRQGPEGGGREYLVSWHGYDSSWNTWEPAANIRAPKLIAAFERRQSALDAPPPSKRRPAALAAAGASSSGGSGGISLAKKEGKAMVGVRVRVWWEYDAKWFAGTVRRLPTRSPGNPLTVGRFAVLSSSPRGPSPPPSSP